MLAAEDLSIGGRKVPGFGVGAPLNVANQLQKLTPCARVSFQLQGGTGTTSPTFDPSYWAFVSESVLNGVANINATFIGAEQAMPSSFPDQAQGYGVPWTLTGYTVDAAPYGTAWNGSRCVPPVTLHAPYPITGGSGGSGGNAAGAKPPPNTAKPAPSSSSSSSSSTWEYVAGAVALAAAAWFVLR